MASRKTFNPAALSGPVAYGPSRQPSAAFEPVYTDKAGEEAIAALMRLAMLSEEEARREYLMAQFMSRPRDEE